MSRKALGYAGIILIITISAILLKNLVHHSQPIKETSTPVTKNAAPQVFEPENSPENSTSTTMPPSIGILDQPADPPPTQNGLVEFSGRVVDTRGQGIPRAFVFVRVARMRQLEPFQADDEGFFRILTLNNANIELFAKATHFQTARKNFQKGTIPDFILIEMLEGEQLELRVLSEFGKPIEGAKIQAEFIDEHFTDKEGYALLNDLSDPVELSISAKSFLPQKLSVRLSEKQKIITLDHERGIQGQVIDKATQRPVPLFTLKRISSSDSPPQKPHRIQDPSGRFDLSGLSRSALALSISAEGYLPFFSENIIPWIAGAQPEWVIELDSDASALEGIVTNSDGLPIEGAEVHLLAQDPQMQHYLYEFPRRINGQWEIPSKNWLHGQFTLSDRNGHFKVGPVPQNLNLTLLASKPRYGAAMVKEIHLLEEHKRSQLAIQLEDPAHLRVEVDFENFDRELKGNNVYGEELLFNLAPGQKSLEINHLPPGHFSLSLTVARKDPSTSNLNPSIFLRERTELLPGGHHLLVFKEPKKLKLSGQAMINGRPFANVRLQARCTSFQMATLSETSSDANGYFDFGEIYEGSYRLTAFNQEAKPFYLGGDQEAIFTLETDTQDALLNFHTAGAVTGRILHAPVGSHLFYSVTTRRKGGSSSRITSLDFINGQPFSFSNVFPDQYVSLILNIPDIGVHYFVLEIPMPADGRDLDLGDLDFETEPRLRLILTASPETADLNVGFGIFKPDGHYLSPLYEISQKKPQLTIARHSLEFAIFDPLLDSAWESEPERASFNFKEKEFHSQTFTIRQVTSLLIRLTAQDAPFVPLKEVSVRSLEVGTPILLESVSNENQNGSFFRLDSVQIRKVPPGPTEVVMTLTDGRNLRVVETLRPGTTQNLVFNIANFE